MLLDDTFIKVIEGLLFISETPLSAEELSRVLGVEQEAVEEILKQLAEQYTDGAHGFYLRNIAGGYQFYSSGMIAPYLEKLFEPRQQKLSSAAYETLAIIAYRQPVTRSEIESIRGVKSEGPLQQLLVRGLVEEAGRKDAPGRPIEFATGQTFLQAFGLNSLEDLPRYDEGKELARLMPDVTEEPESTDD